MKNLICNYSKDCPVYNEKEKINETPIIIFRNVFCKRGQKGWDNCEKFLEYKSQELLKNNKDD